MCHLFLLQSKSSRNVKYKDYFMDEDPAQCKSNEEDESELDQEEEEDDDDEETDKEDFDAYVYS